METARRDHNFDEHHEKPQEAAPGPAAGSSNGRPEEVMSAYIGYLAGWFDIAQLAAGRRLQRNGVREPLLNDQ